MHNIHPSSFLHLCTILKWWNATAFCDDPKRPRDVCEAPMLDLNDGMHVSRVLPYLSFNQYRSERTHGSIDTITIGDGKIKADITPQCVDFPPFEPFCMLLIRLFSLITDLSLSRI